MRDYVLQAAPEARYIGGRQDLPVSGAGHGREVLYFEAPALGLCESVREEYEAEGGPTYTVIVVGQGSFESGRGATCIPEV